MVGTGKTSPLAIWSARIAVAIVFILNVQCALVFIFTPALYVSGFDLAGDSGIAMVRGLGVAFLMWNATYPLVIWHPDRYQALFAIVLIQQLIGLVGEACIFLTVQGNAVLAGTIARFVLFDAAGFLIMGATLVLIVRSQRKADTGR